MKRLDRYFIDECSYNCDNSIDWQPAGKLRFVASSLWVQRLCYEASHFFGYSSAHQQKHDCLGETWKLQMLR